jgi:hypothetical protein
MYIVQLGRPLAEGIGIYGIKFDRFFVSVLDSPTFIKGVKLNVFAGDIR